METFMEFRLGIANAWLGSLIIFLGNLATFANKKLAKRMMDTSWYSPREKRLLLPSFIFQFGFLILTIWIPLKTETIWFYIGTVLFSLGFIANIIATYNYATTNEGEAVTKGMYKLSRNPLYFCFTIMSFSLIIASLSLPLFTVWAIHSILTHLLIIGEERYCKEKYGKSYQEYMQKVPRYFLL